MKAAKAIAAFVGTIAAVVIAALVDNQVDQGEISQGVSVLVDAALTLAVTLGVYQVPNRNTPPGE